MQLSAEFLHMPWLPNFAACAKKYGSHFIDFGCKQNHYQYIFYSEDKYDL